MLTTRKGDSGRGGGRSQLRGQGLAFGRDVARATHRDVRLTHIGTNNLLTVDSFFAICAIAVNFLTWDLHFFNAPL